MGAGMSSLRVLVGAVAVFVVAGAALVWWIIEHDADACAHGAGGERINACTRLIDLAHAADRGLPAAYAYRGLAYRAKDDTDRAIVDYSEAIRLDPKYVIAFVSRGIAYPVKGDYDRAIADYNEAVRLDPKYALAFYGRGLAYHLTGDFDRAIADYSEAIAVDPTRS